MELILRLDRAAAFRLAGPIFPVPHRIDLAAAARRAPHPDLFARGQRRGGGFRRPPPAGARVSYGTFPLMAKSTGYYRQRCTEYGWEPGPDDIIYRANMILGDTDEPPKPRSPAVTPSRRRRSDLPRACATR